MLLYLEKFNSLPVEIRNKISSPEAMSAITGLESRYGISLAAVIMRIMVKDISLLDLEKYFVFEHNLDGKQAHELVDELYDKVFVLAADYLGIAPKEEEPAPETEEEPVSQGDEKLDNWMNGRRQETGVHSSDFFFSTEDEEDVRKLAEKFQELSGAAPKVDNAPEIAAQAVKELDYNFSSEELAGRFEKILIIYIKGVRNKLDTKQTLLKPIEEGGLDLNDVLADKALIAADKVKEEFITQAKAAKDSAISKKEEKGAQPAVGERENISSPGAKLSGQPDKIASKEAVRPGVLPDNGERDAGYDFSALEKREKAPAAPAPQGKAEAVNQKQPFSNAGAAGRQDSPESVLLKDNKARREAVLDLTERKGEDRHSESFFNIKRSFNKTGENGRSGKIKMEDVKHVPKLSGPIDELSEMDLKSFRRLEEDSIAAAKKIKDKISFLEEDGYAKKLAGVKAWRQSPLNKMYLWLGQEAITAKKGINSVIGERQSAGEDCLSEMEFNAIMELNKDLRF